MIWSPERIAELKHLALTMSAKQIADQWGVTRNTVSGKLSRLGIAHIESKGPRRKVSKARKARIRKHVPQAWRPQAPAEPARPLVVGKVTIWQLRLDTCRWPLWCRGGEPIAKQFYCGGEAVRGAAYCGEHCNQAFAPQRPPMRHR